MYLFNPGRTKWIEIDEIHMISLFYMAITLINSKNLLPMMGLFLTKYFFILSNNPNTANE